MKPKFQPTPSRTSVPQKCAMSTPASPTAAETPVSARPTATTRPAPNRVMRWPVKKLGAYIAMTCHCRPRLALCWLWPHIRIASGADVIRKFISMYDTAPHRTATMNSGWRTICPSGRPPASSAVVGIGSQTPVSTMADSAATSACTRNVAANICGGHRSMVQVTSCGPTTPAATPPAMTIESARGRHSGSTQSAAAKRKDRTTAA